MSELIESKTLDESEDYSSDVAELVGGKTTDAIIAEQKAKQQEEAETVTPQADVKAPKTEEPVDDKDEPEKVDEAEAEAVKTLAIEGFDEPVTPEDVKSWKKYYDDRAEWEQRLMQRHQALKYLEGVEPEQFDLLAPQILPYAYKKKQAPETPDDLVKDTIAGLGDVLPDKLSYEDEEGYVVDVPREKYMPLVEKAIGTAIKKNLPELGVLRAMAKELTEKNEQSSQALQNAAQANGILVLDAFYARHPEEQPTTTGDGESSVDALVRIENSGPEHPEYSKVMRVQAVAKMVEESQQRGTYMTFDQAWEKLYGKQERKKKKSVEAEQEALKAQEKSLQETPGQTVPPDPHKDILDRIPESRADMVNKLFS